MSDIAPRITGRTRMWLETSAPPRVDPPRIVRQCADCESWVFGETAVEASDRLAAHRRRCHG